MFEPLFHLPKLHLIQLGNTQRDAKNKKTMMGDPFNHFIYFQLVIAWMEEELLFKVVVLVPKSNQKPNLTYSNITKCNMKIILEQKIKAHMKIIIG